MKQLGRLFLAIAAIVGAWILATPPSGGPDEPSHLVRSAALIRGELDPVPLNAFIDGFDLPVHIGFPDPGCYAFQPNEPASCLPTENPRDGSAVLGTQSDDYPIWGHIAPGVGSLFPAGWSAPMSRVADALIPALILALAVFSSSRFGWGAASGVLVAITVPVWFIIAVVNPSGLAVAGGVALWTALANGGRASPWATWLPSRLDQFLLAAGWSMMALPRRDGLVYAALVLAVGLLIFDVGIPQLRRGVSRSASATVVASTVIALAWAARSSATTSRLLFLAPFVPLLAIGARWGFQRFGVTRWARAGLAAATVLLVGVGSFAVMSSRAGGFDATVFQATIRQTGTDLRETIGLVGWLDTAVPQTMVFLWLVGLGILVAGAVLADRRRALIGAGAVVGIGIWVSWVLTMVQNDESGTYWQGRYYLPLLVGVPIVLSTAGVGRRDAARLGKAAALLSLVVANVALAAAIRRWGVGEQGTIVPWRWDTYRTVVPPVVLLGLHGAGSVLLWHSVDRVAGTVDRAATRSDRPPLEVGVNLLGYHRAASGLGVAVRQFHAALVAAGIPVTTFDVELTDSPTITDVRHSSVDQPARSSTIAVVTPPELPEALAARPRLRDADVVVGYWFWELDTIPASHADSFHLVDAVWAPTTFVADAYQSHPDAPPVHLHPLHLAAPIAVDDGAHTTWRRRLAPRDEFVFLVALDLFSIVERKNPFAVIDAYAAAFESTDAEVRLILKTLNGDQRPQSMRRITDHVASSGIEERIDVIDEFVTDADMAAMIAAADCLVSLHRGEGLGLHMADAMWLGTTVLASRYSGNLDFMDDGAAALVDVQMIDVENGEGAYPPGFRWADPDVAHAAEWMRKLVDDPTVGARLVEQARRRMESQPSEADRGRQYADALNHDVKRVASAPPDTVTD